MEENSLLLQVARAMSAVGSNQLAETKARLFFTGNSALQLLQEKYNAHPEIISNLLDSDAYTQGEWKEITRFVGQYNNYINNEVLRKWSEILDSELHIALVTVYWPSFRAIELWVKGERSDKKQIPAQQMSDDSQSFKSKKQSQCAEFQVHYDKCIKLIRSAQIVLNLNGYEHNPVAQKVNKEYPKLIEIMSLFTLQFTDCVSVCEAQGFLKIQQGIVQNSVRILQHKAQSDEVIEEDKIIFENVTQYRKLFEQVLNQETAQKALNWAYQGLIQYYKSVDDMDNLYKMQSKKEMLDISATK